MTGAEPDLSYWRSLLGSADALLREVLHGARDAASAVETADERPTYADEQLRSIRTWKDVASRAIVGRLADAVPPRGGRAPAVDAAVALAASYWCDPHGRSRWSVEPEIAQLDELADRAQPIFAATHRDELPGDRLDPRRRAGHRAMESVAAVLVRGDFGPTAVGRAPRLPVPQLWGLAYTCFLDVAVDSGLRAWASVEQWLFRLGSSHAIDEFSGFEVSRQAARLLLLAVTDELIMCFYSADEPCPCAKRNPDGRLGEVCNRVDHKLRAWAPADPRASLANWFMTFWCGPPSAEGRTENGVKDGGLRRLILAHLGNAMMWEDTVKRPGIVLRAGQKLRERCSACDVPVSPAPTASRGTRKHARETECTTDLDQSARFHGEAYHGLLLEPVVAVPDDEHRATNTKHVVGSDERADGPGQTRFICASEIAPLSFEIRRPFWSMDDQTVRPDPEPDARTARKPPGVAKRTRSAWAYLPRGSAYREFAEQVRVLDLDQANAREDGEPIDVSEVEELKIVHSVLTARRRIIKKLVVERDELPMIVTQWMSLFEINEGRSAVAALCAQEPGGPSVDSVRRRVEELAEAFDRGAPWEDS